MSDFPQIRLGSVATAKGGAGFPEKYQGGQSGIPFIKVSDMNLPGNERIITTANNYVSPEIARTLGAKVFNKGDIVFAKVGAALLLNRRRILTGPTVIDNNMMALTPEQIDGEFLYHFLVGYDLAELVQTGALPSVNQSQIQGICIPNFSPPEQRGIAEVLSALDEQIEATETLALKRNLVKTGLMASLLGGTSFTNLKALSALADVVYGASPNGFRVKSSPFPMYGTGGLVGFSKEPLFKQDSVIIPRKGSLGNPLFVKGGFWAIDTTYAAIPKAGVDAKWLYYQLLAFDLTKLNESTGVPSISRDWLFKQTFETPDYARQVEISETLSNLDDEISAYAAEAAKLRLQKQGLMRDLLTGKVRVAGGANA